MYYIGLISGTSVDGVDAIVVSFPTEGALSIHATLQHPYPPSVHTRIQAFCDGHTDALAAACALDVEVGEVFAEAARRVLAEARLSSDEVVAIGSHGQTLLHMPDGPAPFSLQIGKPAVIAEGTGILTVGDFRAADIAAGGQGAPLAPGFHAWLFQSRARSRLIVNVGGIANVTYLPADTTRGIAGFDTGPGNTLMDQWIHRHRGQPYDRDGAWAAGGTVQPALLQAMLADPYFARPGPKSTGREQFNMAWLEGHLAGSGAAPQDVQATLLALTATTISDAAGGGVDEIVLCGGGAHNTALLRAIEARSGGIPVCGSDALGLHPDWVEAAAFAWMARQFLARAPANLPAVTGARHPAVLGVAAYPAPRPD